MFSFVKYYYYLKKRETVSVGNLLTAAKLLLAK